MLVVTLKSHKEDALILNPDGEVIGKVLIVRVNGKQVRVGFDLDKDYRVQRIPSNDED